MIGGVDIRNIVVTTIGATMLLNVVGKKDESNIISGAKLIIALAIGLSCAGLAKQIVDIVDDIAGWLG